MKDAMLNKARKAWGDAMPEEVEALARTADRLTGAKAARLIGYSSGVVSTIITNNYKGDVDRVKAAIRGALMSETVSCPVLGEIGTDYCLQQQKMGNTGASAIRAMVYRACRGVGGTPKCVHSRIKDGDDA